MHALDVMYRECKQMLLRDSLLMTLGCAWVVIKFVMLALSFGAVKVSSIKVSCIHHCCLPCLSTDLFCVSGVQFFSLFCVKWFVFSSFVCQVFSLVFESCTSESNVLNLFGILWPFEYFLIQQRRICFGVT